LKTPKAAWRYHKAQENNPHDATTLLSDPVSTASASLR